MRHSGKNIFLLVSLLSAASLASCGGNTAEKESSETSAVTEENHSWDNGTLLKEATCGNPSIIKYTCSTCGATKEVPSGTATGSHSMNNNVCDNCGYIDMSSMSREDAISKYGYYHIDKDNSKTINTSDRIVFGSYPQSEVKENGVITSLNAAIDESKWVSYGYSVNNAASDCMKYQDVVLNNEKYRAVKVDALRPFQIDVSSDNSFMSQNGYTQGNTYWFKFEPIEWRVLDYANGIASLQTIHAIDAQSYAATYTKNGANYLNADGTYVNNWESSYIRSFLNNSFYSWAFSSEEQSKIVLSEIDNSTTDYSLSNEFATAQKNTQDKIYLLSYQDTINERYNLPNVESGNMAGEADGDVSVCKSGTEYALCQGLRISNQTQNEDNEPCSWWMLRSAGGKNYSVCGISKYGTITKSNAVTYTAAQAKEQDGTCFYTAEGIAAAMQLTLGK